MRAKIPVQQSALILNRLLHPIDNLFAAAGSGALPPPLFIVGPPRSGSTLTYQLVTQNFQVGYMTAPLAYAHGMINVLARLLRPSLGRPLPVFESHYGKIPGILSPSEHALYWYRWFPRDGDLGHYLPPETIAPHAYADLKYSLDSLASILNRPWVFKNLYLSISSGALARILPEARFLVVRREPLLACQSILGMREQLSAGEWWSVKPPHYREWREFPLWQQVARQVFYAEAIPRRDLKKYAVGRFLEIDYPTLCRHPREILQKLHAWLGPLGYQTYPDAEIPESFQASEKIRLDALLSSRILNEFRLLRSDFDATPR